MAMLKVLTLGNHQSEATTDVTVSTDIYPCNTSTGARADRTEGIASLNPVGRVLRDRWAETMAALRPTVSSRKDMGKDEPPPGRGSILVKRGSAPGSVIHSRAHSSPALPGAQRSPQLNRAGIGESRWDSAKQPITFVGNAQPEGEGRGSDLIHR